MSLNRRNKIYLYIIAVCTHPHISFGRVHYHMTGMCRWVVWSGVVFHGHVRHRQNILHIKNPFSRRKFLFSTA